MIYCINHRGKEATYHCAQCQIAYCKDCSAIKDLGRTKIEICPQCKNPVTNMEPYKPVPPFWTRIPDILSWPFQEGEWVTFVGWAVFAFVVRGLASLAIYFGYVLGLIGAGFFLLLYYSLLVSYFYRIMARAEDGKFDVPSFTEFEGLASLLKPVIQFYATIVAIFSPFVVFLFVLTVIHGGDIPAAFKFGFTTPVGYIALLISMIIGIPLLPMGFLVMGVFRRILLVLNPVFLVSQVIKILPEYLIALAMIVGMLILYSVLYVLFHLILSATGQFVGAILVFPIDSCLQLYLFMVIGHLLGYMAYQTRFKLKWWPENKEEPVFMIAGTPVKLSGARVTGAQAAGPAMAAVGAAGVAAGMAAAGAAVAAGAQSPGAAPQQGAAPPPMQPDFGDEDLARKINDGMAMLDHGRHEEAKNLFKSILDQNPRHLGALRGIVMSLVKLGDMENAKKYAKLQARELAATQAFDSLFEMYTETRKAIPDLTFGGKETMMLSKWLLQQDNAMDAAKVLREFAVKNPDEPFAPKALYQCGELLANKLDKKDTAMQMFDYLLKRYPDLPFADQVRMAMSQIKSG